jgi:inner membrane protein
MALWSGLSLLPDVDVIGFAMGVEYGDPWGHRGATHSLTLAIAVGLAMGLAASRLKRPAARTALVASAVLVSHGLLDTMTDGGLGAALLWPFDLTRYFAPWRPIPVAPIGPDFFSIEGLMVGLTELVLFSPVLVFALRSPAATHTRSLTAHAGVLLALWWAPVWFISSRFFDPTRDAIMGVVLREQTAYASGFSEEAFRSILPGASDQEVRRQLGAPFAESWFVTPWPARPLDTRAADQHGCIVVRFERGVVVTARELEACKKLGIDKGMSSADVNRLVGPLADECWEYSWGPGDAPYRERAVCLMDARVVAVIRQWRYPEPHH